MAGVTHNRKTHVRFDLAETQQREMPFALEQPAEEISRFDVGKQENVTLIPGIGWRLTSYNEQWQRKTEQVSVNAPETLRSTAFGGILHLAGSIEEINRNRKNSELTNAYTGVTELADEGDIYYQKTVPADEAWDDAKLEADEAAFPGPDYSVLGEVVGIDRIAVTTEPFNADEEWSLQITIPGRTGNAPGIVGAIYYSAPAGADSRMRGHGLYALVLCGDGNAQLMERGTSPDDEEEEDVFWLTRKVFKWAPEGAVCGRTHFINYSTDAVEIDTGWVGRTQVFTTSSIAMPDRGSGNSLVIEALIAAARTAITASQMAIIYRAPSLYLVKTQIEKWRLDMRRDIRALWSIQRKKYHPEGSLTGDMWSFPFVPTDVNTHIRIEWYGNEPSDSSIDATLYSILGTEMTLVASGGIGTTGHFKTFEPDPNERYYYLKFTLERSTSGDKSPTLKRARIIRNGVQAIVDPGEFEPHEFHPDAVGFALQSSPIQSVSVQGADGDPTTESAHLQISDLTHSCPRLNTRGKIRVQVETEYDANDPELRSVLFAGYAKPQGRRFFTTKPKQGFGGGGAESEYPSVNWRNYDINCTGMWRRLEETPLSYRFDFGKSGELGPNGEDLPYKATDVLVALLSAAGFDPDTQIAITDLPIRLWGDNGDMSQMVMDPLANINEHSMRIAREYLGTSYVWCGNSGTGGMWRLVDHKSLASITAGAHTILAKFYLTTAPSLVGKANWVLGAYPVSPQPSAFVRKRTLSTWTDEPEGNLVLVTGSGQLGAIGRDKVSAWAANPKSFDVRALGLEDPQGPDPDHPDYLGHVVPIYVLDPAIAGGLTEEANERAAKWVCRRVYDMACHGVRRMTFEAPLVLVTDPLDEYQTRPRPLRWYDPVYVDDEVFLVRSCTPTYQWDEMQMATYELEAPRH